MKQIVISGQNMTEGKPTGANLGADIFIGQEVDGPLVKRKMADNDKKTYLPRRDRNQCISWDPDVLHVTDKRWIPFHRSGEAEGWDIPTPARGVILVKGQLRDFDMAPCAIMGAWVINSWGKKNDEGPERRRIAEDLSLTVIQNVVDAMHRQGRTVIMEADANNVRWSGMIRGMKQIHPHGLDRMWVSTNGILTPTGRGVWEGPTTGVGTDMRHHSLNVILRRK